MIVFEPMIRCLGSEEVIAFKCTDLTGLETRPGAGASRSGGASVAAGFPSSRNQ